jgi:hypothetical protein
MDSAHMPRGLPGGPCGSARRPRQVARSRRGLAWRPRRPPGGTCAVAWGPREPPFRGIWTACTSIYRSPDLHLDRAPLHLWVARSPSGPRAAPSMGRPISIWTSRRSIYGSPDLHLGQDALHPGRADLHLDRTLRHLWVARSPSVPGRAPSMGRRASSGPPAATSMDRPTFTWTWRTSMYGSPDAHLDLPSCHACIAGWRACLLERARTGRARSAASRVRHPWPSRSYC